MKIGLGREAAGAAAAGERAPPRQDLLSQAPPLPRQKQKDARCCAPPKVSESWCDGSPALRFRRIPLSGAQSEAWRPDRDPVPFFFYADAPALF